MNTLLVLLPLFAVGYSPALSSLNMYVGQNLSADFTVLWITADPNSNITVIFPSFDYVTFFPSDTTFTNVSGTFEFWFSIYVYEKAGPHQGYIVVREETVSNGNPVIKEIYVPIKITVATSYKVKFHVYYTDGTPVDGKMNIVFHNKTYNVELTTIDIVSGEGQTVLPYGYYNFSLIVEGEVVWERTYLIDRDTDITIILPAKFNWLLLVVIVLLLAITVTAVVVELRKKRGRF